jgi:hypothetical protein
MAKHRVEDDRNVDRPSRAHRAGAGTPTPHAGLAIGRRALLAGAAGVALSRLLPPQPRASGQEMRPDETFIPGDSIEAWALFNPAGGAPQGKLSVTRTPGTFRDGRGAVEYRYTRIPQQVELLGTAVLLTNLRTIETDVWSQVATTVVVGLEDRDGATFHWPVDLEPGKWRHVRIGPRDFRLNDDSKVKKSAVDPRRLGAGLAIADLGPLIGGRGPNVLRINALRVARDPLRTLHLPSTIDKQTLEISQSAYGQGPTVVQNGGVLKISAPRFALAGNVAVENGTLIVAGTALSLHGRYAHDLGLLAANGSLLRFADSIVSAQYPSGVGLDRRSLLEIVRTEFSGAAFTVSVLNGCAVTLERAKNPGEFILAPGGRITIAECEAVLLWLATGPRGTLKLTVPEGRAVEAWSLPRTNGTEVSIRKSRGILWGLISESGSDVAVEGSKLIAVGVHFGSPTKQVISGIRNGQPAANLTVGVSDRKLRLAQSAVGAWNFYAASGSRITLRDCTFGECIASETARLVVEQSTCDGTGGYVRAEGKGVLEVKRSHLIPDVVATEDATLLLEDCTVDGSLRAAGRARVRIVNTKIGGAVERFDGAAIERR